MQNPNPFAPAAYNGLSGDYPHGYVDAPFDYLYNVTLTAGQFLRDQVLPIATDADFLFRAVIMPVFGGAFLIRFSDSQGTYLSNGMIPNQNFLQNSVPVPYPMFPQWVIPAGGRIGIDIQDLSNAQNVIEITFRGVKRYRLPAAA